MNKVNEKTKRLISWMNGKAAPPYTIELVPTNRCNFSCKSCWRQKFSKKDLEKEYTNELSDKRLLKLIDEAAEIGVKEIAFVGGGEPLIRDITPKLMKKIRHYDMEGDLVTNGSLLTKELINSIVNMAWTRIKFSIDGSIAPLQNKLRGSKSFDKTKESIKKLSKIKKERKSEFPKIGFNVVISNINYKDLPNIVELAHETGCNEIMILPVTVFSQEGENLKLNKEQIQKFQKIIKKCLPRIKEYNIGSNMYEFLEEKYIDHTNKMHEVMMEESGEKKEDPLENFMTAPCFEPWSHITIIANGKIACCFNDYVWNTDTNIKDKSLKEIWYGHYFEKYRKQILTKNLTKACATCCVWRVFESRTIRDKMKDYIDKKNKGLMIRFLDKLKCIAMKKRIG